MSISSMKSAVSNYVTQTILAQTERMKAKRGVVHGGRVVIGDSVYPYTTAVDIYFKDGDAVWCILADNKRTAVVVGV
ncbi:hypothetical protein SELR_11390 [Selenomonas ruminantium subsp. lactilytica TAM6421]|uniref:Uncharacterized protein n=1 Tax=Selenomonas ruminantium subsp. lactilytica (strain NBRC 103574 / TAM6421) TaxID=927704 RepID=I0GQ10_SELRL|nr:hypothetical protein [Selenomonas ruminantium]BAL82847.1 hypothetical protein SELR_11390 [Selenomonas ruminantium subsp. lactilytica TAM6421]